MQTTRLTAVMILIIAGIYLICRLIGNKSKLANRAYNRAKDQLIRSRIARSLEESAPIHLDISDGGDAAFGSGSVLAAAQATETVSAQMAYADEPWAITVPGGFSGSLEKDAVRMGMKAADYSSSYYADGSVFSGTAPFLRAAGNLTALEMKPSTLHLAVGSMSTVPAINDALYSKGEVLCVGGDDLISQAVAAVSADAVYVGEQFTEIPDSLDHAEKTNSSLLAMDVVRWAVIGAVLVFAGIGLTGV